MVFVLEAPLEVANAVRYFDRPRLVRYDLRVDADYMHNVAGDGAYAKVRAELSKRLMDTLKATGDPRVLGDGKTFDRPPYVD